jgi:GTP-binding protein HflX
MIRRHETEKVLIVAIRSQGMTPREAEISQKELEKLVETAGGETVKSLIIPLREPNPQTYIGPGKVTELRDEVTAARADLVVLDAALSGSQLRNVEERLQARVVDRTELILDIFAQHASTPIGKVQVELAQLSHRRTRLRVQAGVLSGLGGGIGTRGPPPS